MDIFDIHNVKMEKANAMILYQSFRNIARLFRVVELFLAVGFVSWISSRLPFVIGVFGDYFRQLLSILVSPLFIFLIGNVIILILVAKSGQIAGNPVAVDNVRSDLYEEIVNNERLAGLVQLDQLERVERVEREETIPIPISPVTDQPEEIVYHDKRIISEVNKNPNPNPNPKPKPNPKPNPKPITGYGYGYDYDYDYCCDENKSRNKSKSKIEFAQATKQRLASSEPDLDMKIYRRSQSENLKKKNCDFVDECYGKLRRSETEIGRRAVETPAVDKLSNEEFQRRIEGFIARQVRFHHEEKLAIVVPGSYK